MNNPSNNPRHQDPSNSSRANNLQNDYFMRQPDRSDLTMHGKPDPKMDFENINDLFMNNLLRNPGSLNQFFDKAGQNPDFFNASSANPQNLPFDPNLLYNFPNMAPNPKMNPNAPQGNPLDQNGLYFPGVNNNFMLPHNFGLNNPNLYEDLLKNSNQPHGQVDMNDKNLFNHGLLSENPGLMESQFLFDDLNHKPQDVGQASNQQNNMGGLNSLQNQMLLNNLAYGGDLGLNSFLLSGMQGMQGMPGMPGMPGFGIEDLYNMQMPGGVPPGQMSHNIGALPMDLKVENPNQMHQKSQNQHQHQHQQGSGTNGVRSNSRVPQEAPQGNQRTEQKAQNPYANQNNNSQQDMTILNGLGSKSMSMPMPMGNNLGMFNFSMPSMQSVQSMLLPKDMDPQSSQLLKFMSGGMDGPLANEPAKQASQNLSNGLQHSLNNAQNPLYNSSKEAQGHKAAQHEESKGNLGNPSESAKPGMLTPNDIDLIGRGLLDPFMMGNPALKNAKTSYLDPLGFDDPSFLEAHSSLYNKMKEKNRYERSLKIERYKNKKRNWAKKIAYDCRKRVADTRLRIKGRFISKKDSEKIQQLVGKQEEAFNEKKNLNLEYLTNKFNITGEAEESAGANVGKSSISRGYLLNKIDEILHNNKNPLPPKNLANNTRLGNIIMSNLQSRSKKIFKIRSRRDDSIIRDPSSSSMLNQPLKQEPPKNMLKVKNEAYSDALAQLNPMSQLGGMDSHMLANRFKNFYNNYPGNGNEGFDMNSSASEMDPHSMPNMNMIEAMALSMGMNIGNMGNMANMANMGMGMRLNPFETRPELHHEEAGHEMARFK